MRAVNLKPLEILTIPSNQSELMRALATLTEQSGADRFAYIQLPKPFGLMRYGVHPRILGNYPEYIVQNYLKTTQTPFNMVIRAVTERQPVFLSEATTKDGAMLREWGLQAGLQEAVVIPIADSDDAAFCFAFKAQVSKSWVVEGYERSIGMLAQLVHTGIQGRDSLCPQFVVPGYTARIREILSLKAKGMTNSEVGAALGIKPDTVKKAITRFSERLGGLSTIQLIYHMTKLGML